MSLNELERALQEYSNARMTAEKILAVLNIHDKMDVAIDCNGFVEFFDSINGRNISVYQILNVVDNYRTYAYRIVINCTEIIIERFTDMLTKIREVISC